MEKYRSIDAGWEFEDIIYMNEPTSESPLIFNLVINGQKAIGIHYYNGKSICDYFEKIGFTGIVTASAKNGRYGISKYIFLNGKLHCENGPAINHNEDKEASWYKRGKRWYCLLDEDKKRRYFCTIGNAAYFRGELW